MGDPFSIATGVAGLVSLGITVCDGLHTYFSAIRDRKDDLAVVTQNLALFKFHIFAVQSSASELGHCHSPVIDGLQLSLINCEMQVKCLETLLGELLPVEDSSRAKAIWRRQRLVARYPFDRKKLVQLEEYLSRANATLSSFIQALNLDINIRMSNELKAFKTSLEALDIDTQTTLRAITNRLDVVGPKVESSPLQLLPSRVENFATSSSNSIFLHKTAAAIAELKTCCLGNERTSQHLPNTHSTSRYLENAGLEQRLFKRLADIDCTCGASNSKSSNRPTSRTYRFWGGLTVSRQGDVQANHRPGCIFFQKSSRNISRTSVTYFGLLSLFSQSFTVSLTQDYPAGPYSVSFGLQPCNITNSSPALRLFCCSGQSDPRDIYWFFTWSITRRGPDHIAETLIEKLRIIYRSRKASPFDVDQYGNNIAHMCLSAFLFYFKSTNTIKSPDTAIDAILKMIHYLADIGVPITASNFNQSNILTISTRLIEHFWILPRLYKLVINHDSNFYVAELAHNGPRAESRGLIGIEEGLREITALCECSEIRKDIGFSELFLVIMSKDYAKLQALLDEEDHIINLSQTDFCNRNILHASSNWPDGLRLLLQRHTVRSLMEMPSHSLTPLDYALLYSKICCSAPDQWTDCDECTCSTAVQLLLQTDCSVPVSLHCPELLAGCSLKARRLFFEHLKDRRERLRNIAIAVLSEESLRQYGVSSSFLPDKTAPFIWSELQEIKEQLGHRSIYLNDSLKPYRDSSFEAKSFFAFPHARQVAELAIGYGFIPKDEIGVPTLLSDWLLQHDLKLELCIKRFQLSALHCVAVLIGERIDNSLSQSEDFRPPLQTISMSELQDAGTLLAAVCQSQTLCNTPCPCSSGMFSRPLAYVFPLILLRQGRLESVAENVAENIRLLMRSIDLLQLPKRSSEQLYMAKCAIHILTMMFLGVRHLPICISRRFGYLDDAHDEDDEQEWREILDEDLELIGQLEALDEEFGEAFDRQNIPIADFLSGYWLTRMEEVVGELNKPLTDTDRCDLLEAGVVLKEDATDCSERCIKHL